MIDSRLVAEYFGEAFYVISAPTFIHFPVATEFAAHKIMGAVDACDGETIGLQGNIGLSADGGLGVFQEFLNIAHGRIEHLAFMQPVSVPGAQLIFPV